MLTSRGLGTVLGDLASMGFDARWGVLGAADVGAKHQRDRIWLVAKWRGQLSHAQHDRIRRWEQQQESIEEASGELANTSQLFSNGGNDNARISMERETKSKLGNNSGSSSISNSNSPQCQRRELSERTEQEYAYASDSRWWETEPNVGRMVDGMASGVDRLKAIGNGQVPLCAATAWRVLNAGWL